MSSYFICVKLIALSLEPTPVVNRDHSSDMINDPRPSEVTSIDYNHGRPPVLNEEFNERTNDFKDFNRPDEYQDDNFDHNPPVMF